MIRLKYAALALLPLILGVLWLLWINQTRSAAGRAAPAADQSAVPSASSPVTGQQDSGPTLVYAHNLRLLKGPSFRIYIRWIRGQMLRTRPSEDPSFDDPDSFVFLIQKGVIHANLGDIGNFINAAMPAKSPLQQINFAGEGEEVRISGMLHKFFLPLPVEVLSTVSASSDGRIHLHVTKINLLKIPMKGLLGGMNVQIKDVMGAEPMKGVEVSGNDLLFDTTAFLPPPHIRGQLTSVTVARPDLVLIYGNAGNDEAELSQWHNFLRLTGGTVAFGKLTMHPADLTLIDASEDPWFSLDLVNYQAQLVSGVTRMTAQAGIEIFMPNYDDNARRKSSGQGITLAWLKNRNRSLPADVPVTK